LPGRQASGKRKLVSFSAESGMTHIMAISLPNTDFLNKFEEG